MTFHAFLLCDPRTSPEDSEDKPRPIFRNELSSSWLSIVRAPHFFTNRQTDRQTDIRD